MEYKIMINENEVTYYCSREVRLESARRRSGARLTFHVINNAGVAFWEGDTVTLEVDGIKMFKGYIFSKRRTKNQIIETICYDQLIYLKLNKETYIYEDMTATEVIQKIAGEFQLTTGLLADTKHVIPHRIEDIQTLIDIIYTALDITLVNTGDLFILYDNNGEITLDNINDMRIEKTISADNGVINFDYQTDINTNTFNKVKLVRDNEETGMRDTFIEKDSSNMDRWGILQLHEKVSDNLTEGQIIDLVQRKLALHNRLRRTLKVKYLQGDPNIRAGNSLMVDIPYLGDIHLSAWLIVDRCTHILTNSEHRMTLDLVGDF